jgi:hypothetical protein
MRNNRGLGKIELMYSAMDRVDLDCGCDIETSLFEAQAHTAGASEEVDPKRPSGHFSIPDLFKFSNRLEGACRSKNQPSVKKSVSR